MVLPQRVVGPGLCRDVSVYTWAMTAFAEADMWDKVGRSEEGQQQQQQHREGSRRQVLLSAPPFAYRAHEWCYALSWRWVGDDGWGVQVLSLGSALEKDARLPLNLTACNHLLRAHAMRRQGSQALRFFR